MTLDPEAPIPPARTPVEPPQQLTPAGWYPDSKNPGVQRWWDGTQWTEHVTAPAAPAPQMQVAMPSRAVTRQHKPTNHILHLILSIVTAGLWVPVWIIVTIMHKTSREKIVTHYQ